MAVMLSDAEAWAVRSALDNYLPELAYDLARLDRKRDQHELARLDGILRTLRERLGAERLEPPDLPPTAR